VSTDLGGGEPVQIDGIQGFRKGTQDLIILHVLLSFSGIILTKNGTFRTNPRHSANDSQSFRNFVSESRRSFR
jgi:hypothetical protein